MLGNEVEQIGYQIAVGVDHGEAPALLHVTLHQVLDQRGLAGAGGAEQVEPPR
ncbi:MAG TPA: hypothetical protein VNV37_08665 [Solirubrobacteraceae bacterium]|nr:hypothetical protein [Solirubrobacteraceae bacterium]